MTEMAERATVGLATLTFATTDWAQDAARAAGDVASGQCTQCHLGGFPGDSTNPRLAGQSVVNLQTTMQAFHDGTRANNPWMNARLKTYPEDELATLARYLGGL